MSTPVISRQMGALLSSLGSFFAFATESTYMRRRFEPGIADFVFGNPHEMPLAGFSEALQRWSVPQHKDWFAYKMSEPAARAAVAAGLRERRDITYHEDDIFMTTGGFAGLSVAMRAVVDAGDEVIFISPPWFFHEPLIVALGATAVRVRVQPDTFDLDLAAIEAAITPRTRGIIVNSPNNPTGVIYPPATLAGLARLLTDASARHGRPIFLFSDEAYSRIIFDGRPFPSPTTFYPYSFLIYTYGKQLLTPGQRVGYIALPPEMPDREALRPALLLAQIATGYAFPNAVLQYAVADLERLLIDIAHLQRKRDHLVEALRSMGYQVHSPAGTFYLMPRSPLADDLAFTERLAERDVFVLPGTVCELPGYFRLSLTANDEMIERALPAFAAARRDG